jgi:hypothetical protein
VARYKLVAMSNAVEGRDDDYNEWYRKQHMPDVLAVPGFVSGERLQVLGDGPFTYCAIFEIETDDIGAVLADFGSRPGTDLMPVSDSLDLQGAQIAFWTPMES